MKSREQAKTRAQVQLEIDARLKRLSFIRAEERKLVAELDVLWSELKGKR